MRSLKILICLRIFAVWSESSMGAFWTAKDKTIFHTDNEDSDQAVPCAEWFESSLSANVRRCVFASCGTNKLNQQYKISVIMLRVWYWSKMFVIVTCKKGPYVVCWQQRYRLVCKSAISRIYPTCSDRKAWANSVDPDQTPRFAASDLDLRCLPFIQQKRVLCFCWGFTAQ